MIYDLFLAGLFAVKLILPQRR